MYKLIFRPLLFLLSPEKAHHIVFGGLKFLFKIPFIGLIIRSFYTVDDVKLSRRIMGINFPNPIGLAAGFDKDAKLFDELGSFGFGFIEIGTLTPKGQDGNPKPRMFRLPADRGLINRMGFNNEGVDAAVLRLKKRPPGLIIGGNIGKNKLTSNEEAIRDYDYCFHALFPWVDYFVVNVSSPNTPGLRALQEKEPLRNLLMHVQKLNKAKGVMKPVLLKIAPDLTDNQLDEILEIVHDAALDGIIATNTTIQREGLKTNPEITVEAGGLSGFPIKTRSTEVIRYLREKAGKNMVIIGVGGIFTAADAQEKLEAGADLIQVYTGFIYEGPGMIRRILRQL
ncbi:quinone-dependent dihydroorotate dehydrogenase [soil metagenome]